MLAAMVVAAVLGSAGDGLERAPVMVRGNEIVRDGRPILLRGLNVPSLEWSNEGENVMRSVEVALTEWKSNVIRLPLSQDRWFGRAPYQTDGGARYREIVDAVVDRVTKAGAVTVLDLHWSNAGTWGQRISQHRMPDMNSVEFWRDVATRYRNYPDVLFDLYNEPHGVSWSVWRDGGTVEDTIGGETVTYRTPGMQGLVDAVRATGAKNVVVVGGLDWAYDLRGVIDGYALSDPDGWGIVYSAHIYPWKSDWDGHVGRVAKRHPVLVGEVGCEPDGKHEDPTTWAPRMLRWLSENRLHWTAWCFHPSATPRMLKNWDYEPTEFWGAYVFRELNGKEN